MTRLSFVAIGRKAAAKRLKLEISDCFALGYTGRDRAVVDRHIEELEAHGVPAPSRVPTCFPILTSLLRVAPAEIDVYGGETSGEIEPVLIIREGRPQYLGLGSDHTDRSIERISIPHAKQLCPKVLSAELWDFSDMVGRWDSLAIRSFSDGELYQEATLGDLLPPAELINIIPPARIGTAILLCGTVPLKTPLKFGTRFGGELLDPDRGRSLRLEYRVRVLEPIT